MRTSGYSLALLRVLTGDKLDDEDELSAALSLGESVRAYETCGGNSAYSHGYSGYSHGVLRVPTRVL